jgi:hypothetical protein
MSRRAGLAVMVPAIGAAILVPLLLLWPRANVQPAARDMAGIVPSPLPPADAARRRLFLDPVSPRSPAWPPDMPVLVGIAGRLPHDAVAMVRGEDGATRIVAIGQSDRGWRLESLSADAALFVRGTQRQRVPLPASEPVPEAGAEGAPEM